MDFGTEGRPAIAAIITVIVVTLTLISAMVLFSSCSSQPPPQVITKVIEAPPPIIIPPDPYKDMNPEVASAIKNNQTPTIQDGIAQLIPYSPNQEWDVYCQPLNPTEIRLNPDEYVTKDDVALGDTVRWQVKIGEQAVMLEPTATAQDPHMQTTLVIHSNKRSYHINASIGHKNQYTQAIQWYYPNQVRQEETDREAAQKQAATQTPPPSTPQSAALELQQQQELAHQ